MEGKTVIDIPVSAEQMIAYCKGQLVLNFIPKTESKKENKTENIPEDPAEYKKIVKQQFGNDYRRFTGEQKEQYLSINNSELAQLLRKVIEEGQLYICDKESCAIFKAKNVVGWKDGLLILNDR